MKLSVRKKLLEKYAKKIDNLEMEWDDSVDMYDIFQNIDNFRIEL